MYIFQITKQILFSDEDSPSKYKMLFLNSYFIYSWRKIFIQTYLLNEKKTCPSGNHLSSHGGARFHSRFTQNLVTYTRFHTLARMIRLRINRRFTSLLGGHYKEAREAVCVMFHVCACVWTCVLIYPQMLPGLTQ